MVGQAVTARVGQEERTLDARVVRPDGRFVWSFVFPMRKDVRSWMQEYETLMGLGDELKTRL